MGKWLYDKPVKTASIIYGIFCNIESAVYIGKTKVAKARWSAHKTNLRMNRHDSPRLQAAWNAYGEEHFTFEILLTGITELVDTVEKQTMLYYSDKGYHIYNATLPKILRDQYTSKVL